MTAKDYERVGHLLKVEMESAFLGVLADYQRENGTVPAAPADTPEMLSLLLSPTRAGLDALVNAWVHVVDHDCEASHAVLEMFVDAVIHRMVEAAVKKGWYQYPLPGGPTEGWLG